MTKTYRHLLFDVDDTLLDFGVTRFASLRSMCEAHAFPFDDALYARFNHINEGLWRAYEEGRKSGEQAQAASYSPPAYADAVAARGGDALFRANNLPQSGQVLPGHETSGQWLRQPGT